MDLKVTAAADANDDICLPLYFFDLTPELKKQAREELFEDSSKIESALNELRALIKSENCTNFPTGDKDLIPFLRVRKYDVKRAHAMYKKYFAQFDAYDDIYKNFDFSSVIKILRRKIYNFMPKRDVDGAIIAIALTKYWNISEESVTDILRAAAVCGIDLLQCPITQITGLKLIIDLSNLTYKSFVTIRPWHIKFGVESIQSSLPLRFKEIHLLNHGRFFYALWYVIKPMLTEKIVKRVHFHGNDVTSLHRRISPSLLPEELGGHAGPQDNTVLIDSLLKSEHVITKNVQMFRTKDSK